VAQARSRGADWVVMEVADGLLQRETAALLQSAVFRESVDAWVFATNDPLAAFGGAGILRRWGITPVAISGVITMSPLATQEARASTGVDCLTAGELEDGLLNGRLLELAAYRA